MLGKRRLLRGSFHSFSDDRQPKTIFSEGHIDNHLRICVEEGLDPISAIRMATLNAAECWHLNDRGAIAPGLRADIVLLDDLKDFRVRKVWLAGKLCAEDGGYLPDGILWREKAAFSDAVGHSMVDDLKEYAEGLYTDAEFEEKRARYDFAQPFTKESLLYRELFEKYYPGQAHMVADFWMPNRAWKGCDVSDPSARVLANYGDSGK